MVNCTEKAYINHLCEFLPKRRSGRRGPKPIPKEVLVEELFKKFRHGLRWRDLKHSTVCHNYLNELQRRGTFKNFFNSLTEDFKKFRQSKTLLDSSDIVSYRTNGLVAYSGKYHNYCMKMTVEITDDYIPIEFSLDKGTTPDSNIFDKMLLEGLKLPYEMYLDKAYEKYQRRRDLKKKNCQLRIEMKNGKNRKRGPRFKFSREHKRLRGEVEKIYGWLKAFNGLEVNKLKKKSLIMAKFIICLSYIVFIRLQKL